MVAELRAAMTAPATVRNVVWFGVGYAAGFLTSFLLLLGVELIASVW